MSLNKALTEEYDNEVSLPFVLQQQGNLNGSNAYVGSHEQQERAAAESSLNQSWIGSGVVYADYYTLTTGNTSNESAVLNDGRNNNSLESYDPVLFGSDDEDEIEDDDFFEVEDEFAGRKNHNFNESSGNVQQLNSSRGPNNTQSNFLASLISDPIGSSFAAGLQDQEPHEYATEASNNLRNNQFELASNTLDECCKIYMKKAKDVMHVDHDIARGLALVSQSYAQRAQAIRLSARLQRQSSQNDGDKDSSSTTPDSLPKMITLSGPSKNGIGTGANNHHHSAGESSKTSSIRDVVRNALHATHEEDMTESVFLGSVTGHPTNSEKSIPKAVMNLGKPSSPIKDSTRQEVNPIDDMLLLEKELQMMDNSLSIQNSVANLASLPNKMDDNASTSMMSSSILYTPKTPSRLRGIPSYSSVNFLPPPSQHGLDSSWLGQSSFISKGSSGTEGSNSFHMPPDGRLWSTSSSIHSPRSPSHQTNGTPSDAAESTRKSQQSNGSGSDHTISAPSSKSVPPTNTKQILRLLDSLKTLGDENAALLKQVEDAQRARVEASAVKKEMKVFQRKYQERFTKLKTSLEDIYKKEARDTEHSTNDAGNGKEKNVILNSKFMHRDGDERKSSGSPPSTSTSRQQIKSMEAQIKLLSQQLTKLQEDLKKKDSQMKKYETFYKEVKARSAQRAAERQSAKGKNSKGAQ